MNKQEKVWFSNLEKNRRYIAKVIYSPPVIGVTGSVVDKYSDKAHFIYELLQNANDVNASEVSFELGAEGLYFKHNGTIHFTISNPNTEKEDKANNVLGHLNSITSIGNSTKTKTKSSVGKFGVGFKAVFQYTSTPHIYDPNIQFRIEQLIIPIALSADLDSRNSDETVFYFPFDKEEMPAERAFNDILEKFNSLVYPSLFMPNLKIVRWITYKGQSGHYEKKVLKDQSYEDVVFEKLQLFKNQGNKDVVEDLLLFSRNLPNSDLTYSLGYFLDGEGKLMPKKLPAFCYVPTKVTTHLNFIIHAPFLLTDSREGIKLGEDHNVEMVDLLADLSAKSLLILRDLKKIDSSILKIIPYVTSDFYDSTTVLRSIGGIVKWDPNFFAPFYDRIENVFRNEKILPTDNGYIAGKNAIWPNDQTVLNFFSDNQIASLYENQRLKWVFRDFLRNKTGEGDDLRIYIESCIRGWRGFREVLKLISKNFIEKQDISWLKDFYKFLNKSKSYWEFVKASPIFLNDKKEAVPAFEEKNGNYHEVLFLPSEVIKSNEKIVCSEFIEDEEIFAFLKAFGIKAPSLKDEIYNVILPKYDTADYDSEEGNLIFDLTLFFKYWKDNREDEKFFDLIKEKRLIAGESKNDAINFYVGNDLYYPSEELVKFFEFTDDVSFVDLNRYQEVILDPIEADLFKLFLLGLGVKDIPKILDKEILRHEEKIALGLSKSTYGYSDRNYTYDKIIEGYYDNIKNINKERSILLWDFLLLLEDHYSKMDYDGELLETLNKYELPFLSCFLKGIHKYFKRKSKTEIFDSSCLRNLCSYKWLWTEKGELVSPVEISMEELDIAYKRYSKFDRLLEFKPSIIPSEDEKKIQLLEKEGISFEELGEIIKKNKRKSIQSPEREDDVPQPKDVVIKRSIKQLDKLRKSFVNQPNDFDEDAEFKEGVEDLKKKLEVKKNRADLITEIEQQNRYSYGWFLAYLQLLTTYSKKQEASKQKTISFQEMKTYSQDHKYFLLCGASKYISSEIEHAEDFKIVLVYDNGTKEQIEIEGVSKKGQDLLIYSRESLPAISSKLNSLFKVEIRFAPVIDLLERLIRSFKNESIVSPWDDINEAMPALSYIYGPPGTGKTTTICKTINELITSNNNARILVLTPTNKAADVVCNKLNDTNPNVEMLRLSRPTDPDLEDLRIYRDTLDKSELADIHVLASTIHRFPYFQVGGSDFLFQYEWDYVVFDESSMSGLHYITFALMALKKRNPNATFIIAGDPKQIPPVIEITDKELERFDFQDENIYKMMNLESFNPANQKIREKDEIENLTTQYRSIPEIGKLFSQLSYSGLLKHYRKDKADQLKPLPAEFKKIISSKVSFVNIPLDKDNSIFKINKLFYSSYHTYCSILVAEIIKYFDNLDLEETWTIGLISPYKAQAIVLNKLITSYGISDRLKIIADTVHGFQGDECDIVFFVCNPNNYFYSGHEKALLSKEYIYNVAISRARDYLVVLHPGDINNPFINDIKSYYDEGENNSEFIDVKDIEAELFGNKNYIEENSYISGHDTVNVFGLSKMKYFIKLNDTAIDIQLRDIERGVDEENLEYQQLDKFSF